MRGGRGFIRLKPAVHGNYQTKRTDSSAGRESLYINSFCSPTRLFRRRGKVRFRVFLCLSELFSDTCRFVTLFKILFIEAAQKMNSQLGSRSALILSEENSI